MTDRSDEGRGSGDAGFTLVETVVAFAILSLVMTTAVQIIGSGATRTRLGQDRAAALAHAQSHLAALTVGARVPVGHSAGTFDDGFEWRLDVAPLAGSVPSEVAWSPYLAELTVGSPGIGSAPVVLRTILLGPAASARR